jgi:hypothetical protein
MLTYALVKYVAYCLWVLVGICTLAPATNAIGYIGCSIIYGAARWLLGLGFGVLAALFVGSVSSGSIAFVYFGVYIPLRIIEWAIIANMIRRLAAPPVPLGSYRACLWILGGIVVSFLSDIASPEGMEGRFCVGRCLC